MDTLWRADRTRLRNVREDYRDAADFCDNDEFSEARDEYISTLNGLIDSYSSLLVDASTAVRNELNEIIDELADEREEVLSGEACQPVEYVRICDAFGTGFYYIPGTETCLQIGGRVDYGSYFSPSVETGTLILGVGDEVALDKSDTRLEGYGVGFELGIGVGGWLHKLDLVYGQADGDSSAEEPAGGRPVGITLLRHVSRNDRYQPRSVRRQHRERS